MKEKTVYFSYGRDAVYEMALRYAEIGKETVNILDVGAGKGTDLVNVRDGLVKRGQNVKVNLYGLEAYQPYITECEGKGIKIFDIDIEKSVYPFDARCFDIVIVNQVIEHTKEIFWIFSEISRILKPNGVCIVGVPNLASLHNRIGLLFGMQPTSIELLSEHVRGFTKPSFKRFINHGGYFKLLKTKGVNFYPFPVFMGKLFSFLMPTLSVSLFFAVRRTEKEGVFIDSFAGSFFETQYYKGSGVL
jgi:methionine biosynthesis protein MetW